MVANSASETSTNSIPRSINASLNGTGIKGEYTNERSTSIGLNMDIR